MTELWRGWYEDEEPARPFQIAERAKSVDRRFAYRGLSGEAACRLRIYSGDGDTPPLLLFSELADNPGASITNGMETLVPSVIQTYFPHRFDEQIPAYVLEHCPKALNQPVVREFAYDWVSFDAWRPIIRWLGREKVLSLGEPHWRAATLPELVMMLGREVAEELLVEAEDSPGTLDDLRREH